MTTEKNCQGSLDAELVSVFPSLWRFALSLSGRPELADDLSQSTSVRAIERAHQFQPGTNFKAWVFTLCRSIWLNEIRREAIRRTESLESVRAEHMADRFDTEANIFAAEVFNGVMGLPEAIRNTVVLVYVEGFTYREAAVVLDVPIGTVMSRLAAARKRLAPLADEEASKGRVG
ncbi:MAG: RNA polymerase sigma factor [Pseudomonadota bacterium]